MPSACIIVIVFHFVRHSACRLLKVRSFVTAMAKIAVDPQSFL